MTETTFEKGKKLLSEIEILNNTLYSLGAKKNYVPKATQPEKRWLLRLLNNIKDSPSAQERAGVILFDGISPHGLDIPVDEDFVNCLKEFFGKKLEEKQREFEQL